jgi:hypothetical protein
VLAGKYKVGAYSDGVVLDVLLTEGKEVAFEEKQTSNGAFA